MITLITGGSKCGKSSLAERILDRSYSGGKYYIATMQPFGEDAFEAIERHRIMRDGKGFSTIEKYTDIHEIKIKHNSGVLLECIGNLCANEMFSGEKVSYPAEKIISGVKNLSEYAEHIAIVTNEVGCDGVDYSDETMLYIKAMAEINSIIAELSDNVIECVYGIPIILKGEIPC